MFENLELALAGRQVVLEGAGRASDAGAARAHRRVLETHRASPRCATRRRRTLSHGQKQWLEIGMLLMQEPELLLVDEPVAGMTPQETERTAELLVSLAGEHSVVVVEHDMEFVRSIARRVTVLHEGRVLAEGNMDQVQNDPRVIEVYLGSMSMLQVDGAQPVLRRQPHAVGRRSRRAEGSRTCLMGRNGMGKTTLLKCIMGLLPATSGEIRVRRDRSARAAAGGAGALGHRLRAARTRDLSAADGRGEPARRARRSQGRPADDSAANLRSVSRS